MASRIRGMSNPLWSKELLILRSPDKVNEILRNVLESYPAKRKPPLRGFPLRQASIFRCMRMGTIGGFQRTARATCPGGISRMTRTATRTICATRRILIFFLEATGRHSREALPVEKPVDGPKFSPALAIESSNAPESFSLGRLSLLSWAASPLLSGNSRRHQTEADRNAGPGVVIPGAGTYRTGSIVADRSVVIPITDG